MVYITKHPVSCLKRFTRFGVLAILHVIRGCAEVLKLIDSIRIRHNMRQYYFKVKCVVWGMSFVGTWKWVNKNFNGIHTKLLSSIRIYFFFNFKGVFFLSRKWIERVYIPLIWLHYEISLTWNIIQLKRKITRSARACPKGVLQLIFLSPYLFQDITQQVTAETKYN